MAAINARGTPKIQIPRISVIMAYKTSPPPLKIPIICVIPKNLKGTATAIILETRIISFCTFGEVLKNIFMPKKLILSKIYL